MARTLDEVLTDALQLPEAEREALAEALTSSMEADPATRAAWLNEAQRRLDAMRSATDPGLAYDEFFAE